MIQIANYITAKSLRIVALFLLKFRSSFASKYYRVKIIICEESKYQSHNFIIKIIPYVLCIEDRRYYSHYGIDVYSIIRATYKCLFTNKLEGASTILQQLIRNILDEREVSAKRKLNEIFIAVLINEDFSKDEIIYAYLNTYKFIKYKGVIDLCLNENYDINKLSTCQYAQIAARLKYPSITKNNYSKYLKRVRTIEILVNEK